MEAGLYKKQLDFLRNSRSFYPNHSTIAEFRPHSLTLHFHYMNARQVFSDWRDRKLTADIRNHAGVLAHELTHWSDQISTVWGQEYLHGVFDAYNAVEANREELFVAREAV